jgi:3-hydroxyacyl-CoA dehydrogenase
MPAVTTPAVRYQVERDIAVVSICNPPVNALSASVRVELQRALCKAVADDQIHAIVLTGSNSTFVAGADIHEMGTEKANAAPKVRQLRELLTRCDKLTVAAMHGNALGGGLELALACDARVATAHCQFGFPEVKLGILPGAGGTQLLPRLVGPRIALRLLTTGIFISTSEAVGLGIIDAIVLDACRGAIAFAREALDNKAPVSAHRRQSAPQMGGAQEICNEFRRRISKVSPGYLAPLAIVDCVEAACTLTPEEGLALEGDKLQQLRRSDQHAALRCLFLSERAARQLPTRLEESVGRRIERIAILSDDYPMKDFKSELEKCGIGTTVVSIEQLLSRGDGRANTTLGDATDATTTVAGNRPEQFDLLLLSPDQVTDSCLGQLKELAGSVEPHTIFGFSTWIEGRFDRIMDALGPERALGLNWMSAQNGKRLLHIVAAEPASDALVIGLLALGKRLGVPTVLSHRADPVLRMCRSYLAQADSLLDDGVPAKRIDQVAEEFGMSCGPLKFRDRIREEAAEALKYSGRIGSRELRGERVISANGPRHFDDEEIRLRLFLSLAAEGSRCLEEGVVERAGDLDVAWVNGLGFPDYRGGPMYWGRQVKKLRSSR